MSRVEDILQCLIDGETYDGPVSSRVEEILVGSYEGDPKSRVEALLLALTNSGEYDGPILSRIEDILLSKLNSTEYEGPVLSNVEALLLEWIPDGNLLIMDEAYIKMGKYIDNNGAEKTSPYNFYNTRYIPVQGSTKYTAFIDPVVSCCSFMEYDVNKEFIKRTLFGSSSTSTVSTATITTDPDTAYILFGSNPKYDNITMDDVFEYTWAIRKGEAND